LLGNQVRSVPVDIYSEPFRGVWMQHPTSPAKHSVTFETTIDVGETAGTDRRGQPEGHLEPTVSFGGQRQKV
ncbi:MAG: hypothetical protein AAFP69_22790, partial [Planctomycetota bacterium]